MVWSSRTRVVRVDDDTKKAVWSRICAAGKAESAPTPKLRVCCYALQGHCVFESGCWFSHDVSQPGIVGCNFGSSCKLGHEALRPTNANDTKGSALEKGLFEAAQAGTEEANYVESRGLAFDATDPLWDELCATLLEPDEDIGDADLPNVARERLAAEGLYQLLDEDSSDEWLCLPSLPLQPRLEAVQERFMIARQNWLIDDLVDARVYWDTLSDVLSRRRLRFQASPLASCTTASTPPTSELREDAEGWLESATERVDAELKRILLLSSKLDPVPIGLDSTVIAASQKAATAGLAAVLGSGFVEALEAASYAVDELQQACVAVSTQRQQRLPCSRNVWPLGGGAVANIHSETADGEATGSGKRLLGNPLDDELIAEGCDASELHSFRATQLLLCLQRCLHICRSFRPEQLTTSSDTLEDQADFSPSVGAEARVTGLMAIAEQRLNGQAGYLEAFHADLGLWRLRLRESGTRLLLAPERLEEVAEASARTERSRSPRLSCGQGACMRPAAARPFATLLDVVRKAVSKGEHVIVHHVVASSKN